jgi:GDP-D-glucose phosphorylase
MLNFLVILNLLNLQNKKVIDQEAIQLAIEIAFLTCTSNFLMGFNSLNAYASVNHMHLHFYYLMTSDSLKSKNPLPIHNVKVNKFEFYLF